jgi:CDP-diacylglycerol--glycerol-3-phosphate 3-phosphatidyltransferase
MLLNQELSLFNQIIYLRKQWMVFLLVCLAFLGGGFMILSAEWDPVFAIRWTILAAFVCVYTLLVLWWGLKDNHRIDETDLLPGLGAGNIMTLTRALLLAGLCGFLFSPQPTGSLAWLPGIIYLAACLADMLDGFLARRTGQVTELGKVLDTTFDGLGVLIAAWLAIQYGLVPQWYFLVASARYLFLAGIWLRTTLGKPIYELKPSVRGRAFASIQMGFLGIILLPLYSPPGTIIIASLIGIPFLGGFLLDWISVCYGLTSIAQPSTTLQKIVTYKLPLIMRIAMIALFVLQIVNPLPHQASSIVVSTLLSSSVAILIFLGLAGRSMAIFGLCLLGFQQMATGLEPTQFVAAILFSGILFLGTGPYSLWKPEDRLFYRRLGEVRIV